MIKNKWVFSFRLYRCKCNKVFWSRKHIVEHIKDTKRWRKYHSFEGIVFLSHKKGNNINEAFIENKED